MIHTVNHSDGTRYRVERLGSGRFFDTFAVYGPHGYLRVYAMSQSEAIEKARAHYAHQLGLV